jgi:hypothetical protein
VGKHRKLKQESDEPVEEVVEKEVVVEDVPNKPVEDIVVSQGPVRSKMLSKAAPWSKKNARVGLQDQTPEGRAKRQDRFLDGLIEFGTIAAGCRAADIARQTYYEWIKLFPDFKEACEIAFETHIEDLEEVAHIRAADKSDLLLMFALKKLRPEYRDTYRAPVGKPEEEEQELVSKEEITKKLNVLAERRIERIKGSVGSKPKEGTEIEVRRSHEEVVEEDDSDYDVIPLKSRRKA